MPDYYATLEQIDTLQADPRYAIPKALNDANSIRLALAIGDGVLPELPPGKIGDNQECVLARALSNGWKATISAGSSALFHPSEGKTLADIRKSVDALEQLGFEGITHWEQEPDSCECDDPECSGNRREGFWIDIPHTWAMERFVYLFDKGSYPDLILADESQ